MGPLYHLMDEVNACMLCRNVSGFSNPELRCWRPLSGAIRVIWMRPGETRRWWLSSRRFPSASWLLVNSTIGNRKADFLHGPPGRNRTAAAAG